jgi:hypothetical protein
MAAKDDIRELLTTRRATITPEQAGLPGYGVSRRVGGVSDDVLDGVVHALRLDEAQRDHLHRLVRTDATWGDHVTDEEYARATDTTESEQ